MIAESPIWSDLLSRLRPSSQDSLVSWLHQIPLLQEIPRRHLKHLVRHLHRRNFEDGEIVFRQGEVGSGMYLIHHGRVRIISEHETRGELQLALLEAGASFGEMALFSDAPRSATAVSTGRSVVYGLFQGDLEQLERSRPQTSSRLLRCLAHNLSERLRQTNERLREIEDDL